MTHYHVLDSDGCHGSSPCAGPTIVPLILLLYMGPSNSLPACLYIVPYMFPPPKQYRRLNHSGLTPAIRAPGTAAVIRVDGDPRGRGQKRTGMILDERLNF